MFAMSQRKSLLSKLSAWWYLLYAGAASLITALKGFAYSHLFSEYQYAEINYYLLIVGVGVLFVGAGVIIRCHVELPLMLSEPGREVELAGFLSNVRGVGIVFWCGFALSLVLLGPMVGLSIPMVSLSVIQGLLFFLFTIDLLVDKSGKNFISYAKSMFFRNFLIAGAGLWAAAVWGTAEKAVLAEVFFCFILCFKSFSKWFKGVSLPSRDFFVESLKFVPVTVLGAVLQYVDRIFAAILMPAADFSMFSYLFLTVMVGLSIQQLINTRIITLLSVGCAADPRRAFRYMLKVAGGVALSSAVILAMVLLFLRSDLFAAEWVDVSVEVGGLFVICAVIRAADFSPAYIVVMGGRSNLICIQVLSVILFAFLSFLYSKGFFEEGIFSYMSLMVFGFLVSLCSSFFVSWRMSHVKANIV